MKPEKYYSVADVERLFFPSRSARWIRETFRTGEYGAVIRDNAGWMVSESALLEYQSRHAVGANVTELRSSQKQLISRQSDDNSKK
jgi:hypothetical protein